MDFPYKDCIAVQRPRRLAEFLPNFASVSQSQNFCILRRSILMFNLRLRWQHMVWHILETRCKPLHSIAQPSCGEDFNLPMPEPEPESTTAMPVSMPEPEPEPEQLVGPEFQIFTPPHFIGFLNGMSSLIKLRSCNQSFC